MLNISNFKTHHLKATSSGHSRLKSFKKLTVNMNFVAFKGSLWPVCKAFFQLTK